ncbi:serine-rich adhesin for platelets-like [Asterias rubens]|uniref:serine-rich adhesin for platelets-like n=1 Tax=Asterias rubens TaxID=7604 RepID=UPI0014550051|nr:serine-rich adhesin for platelets-like [Asterias rubens]
MVCLSIEVFIESRKPLHGFIKSLPKRRIYALIGWGVPIITVAVTVGTDMSLYGSRLGCLADFNSTLLWLFVVPVIAATMVISCLLILSTNSLVYDDQKGLNLKDKNKSDTAVDEVWAKTKMNKALAEVKAKGDAKLAAFAELAGIQLPAASIKQSVNEQAPLPEQATPMETLKASMKNDKVSLSGMDDTEAIPVSISTDVIAMMTINDTLSKTEELKKQTEELTTDSDSMMSDDNDAEMITKDEKVNEELAQIMPASERPSSSASACSRLIVVAEAKTSIDNTMDETIPAPSTSTSPKTEEKPLNQLASSASSLDKATTNLVDAVFTSLDNEETAQESIVDVQNSDAVINDCNTPLNQLVSSASSLDKATTNLVDAVFTSLDNEETAQESIVDVQNSDAVINDCNMPATKTSTGSIDQQAGFIVDYVFANITTEQLAVAPEKPKMKSTGSIAMDTKNDKPATKTSTGSLDQQAGFIVDSVLANITLEQLSLAAEKPKMKSTGSIATDTEDDMSVSTRSAVDKEEITVIIAQLKKSLSNGRHSTSQMATQTCEISIQTDDVSNETEKPSRKYSALSKIKAVVVKSASKTSRMSFLDRKDKKPNESIKKDLKNNKQALMSQSKTTSVSAKKPGPKNAKVVETKKSVIAKSDVTKKPTGDHKKSSTVTNAKKSSSTSTTKRSSSTDHKKSLTKPRGSAASGRMIREAANGAKVSTKKSSKKVSTTSSTSSATTDAKTKENPAKKLNTSKSASFPCNGSQQKPTASSASAAKTSNPIESSQSASDKPTSKRSKQRTATPVPPPLCDKSSSWKSKSSSGLKQNQSSFLAPQDVASSPSVHAGGKISSVESKDSNIALIPANSQDSFKPNTKLQKRSGRNGSKSTVSITSDNTLRRISSACPAPEPKRAGLASVPELRAISVIDTPTDAGPRCPLNQAMGDNTEVQLESQASVGLTQGDVTGICDTENQVKLCCLEQVQEMDDHFMDLQLQELLLSQEILISPSLMPKEEATVQVTNPLSDKDQLCETPEVVSSKGMFSPRSLIMTADDSDNSTDPVNQSLEVSKSPTRRRRASVESPPGKDATILNPKPPDSKRVSRDFKMNRVTQWTQDSSALGRISVSPHIRRSFDSPGYESSPNLSPTLLALNKSPNDFLNERQFNCAPKSPVGCTSKLAHYVRASESPQGKMTINFSPTQPASRKALSDFLNGPAGQSNTHDNPSKKKTIVDILTMPNLGLSMKVSKTGPGGTRSPEGRTSVSPTNYKKMPSKTRLFAHANNNRPLSGTLDVTNCLFQELTSPHADKEERTSLSSPIYHSPASTADGETHRQQESAKLQLGCIRLQH